MKLLLVEDDRYFAKLITEYLSDNDIDVKTVGATHEALEVSLEDYTGAIIDVMLPNNPDISGISEEDSRGGYFSGVALTRKFRKKNPSFPIVLLSSEVASESQRWAKEQGIPFVVKHESRNRLIFALSKLGLSNGKRPQVFIVHGHDDKLLLELKDYIQNTLKWPKPIVLREEPNSGKTIIEKFEEYAGCVDWIFVLISPDDQIFDPKTNDEKRRARQNVIFELGFFYGLIGRLEGRVIVLKKGEVELPTDIHGIAWIDIENGIQASGEKIRRELDTE